jgi:hypothetical protein
MSRAGFRILMLGCALCTAAALQGATKFTDLRAGERLLLFQGVCYTSDAGVSWEVQLQGCLYQDVLSLESGSRKSPRTQYLLQKLLGWYGVELTMDERNLFVARTQLFMVDNESGRRIVVRCAGDIHELGKTQANGRFTAKIRLRPEQVALLRLDRTNKFFVEAVLKQAN